MRSMRLALAALRMTAGIMLCSLACATGEAADIETAFGSFGTQWIATLNASASKKISCQEVSGSYVAQYTSYTLPSEITVKHTGHAASPYVGVLKYEQQNCSCRAESSAMAMSGPFDCRTVCPVTAIFLYKDGKWQY